MIADHLTTKRTILALLWEAMRVMPQSRTIRRWYRRAQLIDPSAASVYELHRYRALLAWEMRSWPPGAAFLHSLRAVAHE